MALSEGDKVSILALPEGFVDGLPADEAEFMRAAVGGPAKIYDRPGEGMVEIFLTDPATGTVHFAILPADMVAGA